MAEINRMKVEKLEIKLPIRIAPAAYRKSFHPLPTERCSLLSCRYDAGKEGVGDDIESLKLPRGIEYIPVKMNYLYDDMARGRGRIEVILGPMFSGKTTELIRRIRRFKLANFKCLIFKYAKDCRYSENDVATHDLQKLRALPCCRLTDFIKQAYDHEVIGIDEAQFFPDLIQFCEELANNGKIVVVAALDGTYRRTSFGDTLKLIPLAENVVKLNAICMSCFQNASFTKRITSEKAVELIGGADKYMAVCRECYNRNENGKSGTIVFL